MKFITCCIVSNFYVADMLIFYFKLIVYKKLIILFYFSVVKMKFKRIRRLSLKGNKVNTVFKTWRGTPIELRKLRRPHLSLDDASECCSGWLRGQPKKQRYLVMGLKKGDDLVPTFIIPWVKSKVTK